MSLLREAEQLTERMRAETGEGGGASADLKRESLVLFAKLADATLDRFSGLLGLDWPNRRFDTPDPPDAFQNPVSSPPPDPDGCVALYSAAQSPWLEINPQKPPIYPKAPPTEMKRTALADSARGVLDRYPPPGPHEAETIGHADWFQSVAFAVAYDQLACLLPTIRPTIPAISIAPPEMRWRRRSRRPRRHPTAWSPGSKL
jgi:hypothetical protein